MIWVLLFCVTFRALAPRTAPPSPTLTLWTGGEAQSQNQCGHGPLQTWMFPIYRAQSWSGQPSVGSPLGLPHHLAFLLIKGKINQPWSCGTPLPVPGSDWLAPAGRGCLCYLGWWPERRKPTQNGDSGGSTKPSGKLWLAWCLTGHLGEMRSWSKPEWQGWEAGMGILFPFGFQHLEQLLGIVAVRENRWSTKCASRHEALINKSLNGLMCGWRGYKYTAVSVSVFSINYNSKLLSGTFQSSVNLSIYLFVYLPTYLFTHSVFSRELCGRYYPHFIDEETKAQREVQ